MAEICRRDGVSDATFYKWRSKFGGTEPSYAKRLRELEQENAKLKKLVAEAHLDMHAPKEGLHNRPRSWIGATSLATAMGRSALRTRAGVVG
ncbi:transposase [Rubrivivax gelatinosus]|uniref:Transposase n=1 Tax=Rubrivivax gelatinosus TaxID=28068 RepID=A0A4R2ME15_RUBGE|nr:transposase [Rubrivivax gelatinosus]